MSAATLDLQIKLKGCRIDALWYRRTEIYPITRRVNLLVLSGQNRTIKDFGEQWLNYSDNEGYYGSLELFSDILYPFLKTQDIKDRKVAEIGSGTGRIVTMLLESGAKRVIAIEPSDAFEVLCHNIGGKEKVTCLKLTGDQLPAYRDLDYVFSIGVLHHIPEPTPVVEAAFKALRPGGHFFVWLYGKEGNGLYLALMRPLRAFTKRLPHSMLAYLVELIYWPLILYMKFCHWFPLPLKGYMLSVLKKMSPEKRRLIIYDQLNPSFAKYYTRSEATKLLADGKFVNIRIHHRHGYSWTVIGTKPL
ncbi:MAG TPA: class I SAM-dependent methyltransferase [Thermodesulfobacteriota bacterium]|nr:class I SAM-dependent methyltransferase [Thermodesulfobacteriota bacterium]